jgi:hypothetical protein
MKWLIAIASGIGIFIFISLLIFGFNLIMKSQIEKWMNVNVAFGILPRLAVSLDAFLMRNIFFVTPIIFITSLTGALIVAARKK